MNVPMQDTENELVVELLNILWKQGHISEQERDRAIALIKTGNLMYG